VSDIIACHMCNGTGIDEASWDGFCPFCSGTAETYRGDDLDEDVGDGRYDYWVQIGGEDE
jgi:hypothetical protein